MFEQKTSVKILKTPIHSCLNEITLYWAEHGISTEHFLNKTVELGELFYFWSPSCLKSIDLSLLLGCYAIENQLRKSHYEDNLFAQSYLHSINQLPLSILLQEGKGVYFRPWLEVVLSKNPNFKWKDYEENIKKKNFQKYVEQNLKEMDEFLPSSELIKLVGDYLSRQKILLSYIKFQDTFESLKNQICKKDKNYIKILKGFEELAQLFVKKSNEYSSENDPEWKMSLVYALMFYHAAICVGQNKYWNIKKENWNYSEIIDSIKYVEKQFLLGINAASQTPFLWENNEKHRQKLNAIRKKLNNSLENLNVKTKSKKHRKGIKIEDPYFLRAEKIHLISENLTKDIKLFVEYLIDEAVQELGNPPCKYAFIAFGSLEKKSFSPYSDIEFGILLEEGKDTEPNREYFRNLTYLLHIKIINLGETPIPSDLFNFSFDDFLNVGFCFDLGGKTSLGRCYTSRDKAILQKEREKYRKLKYELIGEPKEFLKYSKDEYFEVDRLLPVEVSRCTHLAGSKNITDYYHHLLEQEFRRTDTDGRNLYQKRAITLLIGNKYLKGDLDTYNPEISNVMNNIEESGKNYDVKKEIYRLPDRLIDDLAFFYGVTVESTREKIIKLVEKKILNKKAGNNLRVIDGISKELRLMTYCHYRSQREVLSPLPSYLSGSDRKIFHMDNTKLIERYYSSILPFYRELKLFSETIQESINFKNHLLLTNDFFDSSPKTKAVVFVRLGNLASAQTLLEKYFNQINFERKEDNLLEKARIQFDLGHIFLKLENFLKSTDFFRSSLKKYVKLYGEIPHPSVVLGFSMLGYSLNKLSYIERGTSDFLWIREFSKSAHDKALYFCQEISDNYYQIKTICFDNVSDYCICSGDIATAEIFLNKVNELSEKFEHRKEMQEKKEYDLLEYSKDLYESAVLVYKKFFIKEYLGILKFNSLKNTFISLSTAEQQILYEIEVRKIMHEIPFRYHNLIYLEREQFKKLKIYGDFHPYLANTLFGIGEFYLEIKDFKEAQVYFDKVLLINRKVYPDSHKSVVDCLSRIKFTHDCIANKKDLSSNLSSPYFQQLIPQRKISSSRLKFWHKQLLALLACFLYFLVKIIANGGYSESIKLTMLLELYFVYKFNNGILNSIDPIELCLRTAKTWEWKIKPNIEEEALDESENPEENFEIFIKKYERQLARINYIARKKEQIIGSSAESVGNFDDYTEETLSKNPIHKRVSQGFVHNHAGQDIQNSAVALFLNEKALDFHNWYHPEISHYLLQMAENNTKCIRVMFHDANEGNNTQTFKNQLLQLVMLSHWLKRPALFISKEPGADNHFICGLVKEGNLLLINPLGMTEQETCYQTLAELKQEKILKAVWMSSNALQKRPYEAEGLVSCGPITLELATHIFTNFTPEELDIFWENHLKADGHTTHNASELCPYG